MRALLDVPTQIVILIAAIVVPQAVLIGLVGLCRVSGSTYPVLTECASTATFNYLHVLWSTQRWALLLLVAIMHLLSGPQSLLGRGGRFAVIAASTVGVSVSWSTLMASRSFGATNPLDLAWNTLRMFWERDSPYVHFEGCLGSAIDAECLHYLYTFPVLLGSLGSLPLEAALSVWSTINVILLILCAWTISFGFRLHPLNAFMFSGIFAASSASQNVITNGQYTLLALLLLVGLPIALHNPILSGAAFGLGMFKVSLFVPLFALLAVVRLRAAMSAVAVVAVAGIGSVVWLRAPVAEVLLGPAIVASKFGSVGYAEFGMGDVPRLAAVRGISLGSAGSLILALIGCAVAIFAFKFTRDYLAALSVACIASLIVFPHLPYDYVMLAPSFALALARHGAGWVSRFYLAATSGFLLLSPRKVFRILESFMGIEMLSFRAFFAWPTSTQSALAIFIINVSIIALCIHVAKSNSSTDDAVVSRNVLSPSG